MTDKKKRELQNAIVKFNNEVSKAKEKLIAKVEEIRDELNETFDEMSMAEQESFEGEEMEEDALSLTAFIDGGDIDDEAEVTDWDSILGLVSDLDLNI